jgi:hypothetical protein
MAACVDMFDPMNDVFGDATGLWTSISKHPIVLALTIKELLANEKWSPSPSELRAAMGKAETRLKVKCGATEGFLTLFNRADDLMFEFDREGWSAIYATCSSKALAVLRDRESIGWISEENDEFPPSPRWLMLDDLYKAKLAAEQPRGSDLGRQIPAESEPAREAACEMKPAKRTRKLKNGGRKHEETA